MKKLLLLSTVTVVVLLFPNTSFSQAPNGTLNLGILESFEAYTAGGAITNSGGTVTGDVGTHLGIISGFTSPPYSGNTYSATTVTNQARYDLLRLYVHLNGLFVDFPNAYNPITYPAHGATFGGGETLVPGVYSIGSAGTIGGALTLDGGGNPNAVFVIKMNGAMTVASGATVSLSNGTKSSNVFWLINGGISVAAGAAVKGTLFSKAGAVGVGANVILEGRMLSMSGGITMGSDSSITPPPLPSTIAIFCNSSCTPAPAVDILGVLSGFVLFTKSGDIGNVGMSGINGIIGTNAGAITGNTGGVQIGTQETANALTIQAATDLDAAYIALMNMTPSVTHGATFLNETLAPGVYHIPTAGALGGIIILDAANDSNAIFVFRFAGGFNIAAGSKIILANGARQCNVFWVGGAGIATGAVNIGASSELQGTFLAHGGACNSGAGVFLAGRQLSTNGAINTETAVFYKNPECVTSISLNATIAGTITTDQNICKDSAPNDLTLTGNTGNVIKWQKSSDFAFTSPLDIAITSTTLTSATIGSLSATTFFRTLVQNSTSPSQYSNVVTITVLSTTWTGSTSTSWNSASDWSCGVPSSGDNIVIPGGLTNYPILNGTRTIGNVIIDAGATLNLNNYTLVVSGVFSGTGTLIGSSTSGLTINGSGNRGTFYMNQTTPGSTNKVANFTLNTTTSGSATLGNAMDIFGVLTLTNGTFNTGGNLTLSSNGFGTAVVAPITNCIDVAITGDVTVERFFPALRAFRFISSPVTTTSTIRDNWQQGVNNPPPAYTSNLNPNAGYGTHITGNITSDYGFDATQTTSNSMFTFNNTTGAWVAVPNTNSLTLTSGVPYRLMIRGDRSINMSTNTPTPTNTTLRTKGTLKICDAPAGILSQTANGFSFIGNPYQATVDIKATLTQSSNLNTNSYWVWDPKVNTRGGYVIYDLVNSLNPVSGSFVNQYLQPWQACFVNTISAGAASITFHESDKSTSIVNENVYRFNNLASYIRLTLYESNTLASVGVAADGLIVKFGDSFNNAIDGYDALKFSNLDETFSTKNNTTLLGIESRLFPEVSDVIPLNITQYRFTNYTIVANGTNMSGLTAYLHDQLLQTYTEIPQSNSVSYPFVINTNDAQTSASDRFRIVFQNPYLNLESDTSLVLTISPNPSKQGIFEVVMNGANDETKLIIYNTIGQEVYATNLLQTAINHITPNKVFAKGVYYVKVEKDTRTTIKKLIIE